MPDNTIEMQGEGAFVRLDRSCLPELIRQLEGMLREFQVRGRPSG